MTLTKISKKGVQPLPPTDSRVKRLDLAIRKQSAKSDGLLEILHEAQALFGYISLDVMYHVAKALRISPSRVYGVVTFYHLFRTKPQGEHTALICTGTACHVKGAQAIIDEVGKTFNLKPGQTTADGKLSIQSARCLGCCGIAPAVVIDEKIIPKVKPADFVKSIKDILGASA